MSFPATSLAPWPSALVPGLRLLWTRTLFPGHSDDDSRVRLRSLLILVALPAVLLYPCVNFYLLEPDEGRYAEIAREMLQRHEWVVPHLQGEPYLDKPPLFYWLVMASYAVFGVHDWAARLVPALAVHGTILATYLFGRRLLGERAAFRGALLLSLTPGLMGMGRLLILDGLLTFCVTLGLFTGFRALLLLARSASEGSESEDAIGWHDGGCGTALLSRPVLQTAQESRPTRNMGTQRAPGLRSSHAGASGWWIGCAIACGLGVLTKGPVAVVLVAAPLLLHRWFTTGTLGIRRRNLILFTAIVLAVNLPWYVAVWVRRPEFGIHFFVQHNLQRFLAPFDHLEPIWFYAPVLLGGLLPGTFLLWSFTRWLLSGDANAVQRRSPELGFVVFAGGWCVLFFSLSGSKLPTYILPAFPMLALALGYFWAQRPTRGRAFGVSLVAWGILLALANYIALPWYARLRSPMGDPAAELQAACADPTVPVCCYPRSCDSAAFYLGRDDIRATRSKFAHLLVADLREHERTVVLFTHNHSLEALKFALPPDLRIAREVSFRRRVSGPAWLTTLVGETPWGLCDLAVIERTRP